MKKLIYVMVAGVMFTACKQQTKTESVTVTPDTTGFAAFQAYQQQKTADSIAAANKPVETVKVVEKRSSGTTASRSGSTSGSTTMTSESSNTATKKKGWSKTAKGAVIGGVVGAGTGAVINKKNRAAGAVVGGVVGAGAGAIIGHEKDKKDGRH